MQLPQINQQMQGMNVQAPSVPSGQQYAQGSSQSSTGMPQRVFNSMAPDNGQHGGAPRYMTPTSGAMNMSNQRQANPYGQRSNTYPGQNSPLPPAKGALTPMSMSPEQQQEARQNASSYRQMLQQRLMTQRNNMMGYMMPPQQPQQQTAAPMPPQQLPNQYGN